MTRRSLAILTAAVLAGVPAAAQAPTASPPAPSGEPVVYLGLASRATDGSFRGGAYSDGAEVGEDLTGIVYLAPCLALGASSTLRPPAASTDVWQVGGFVVSLDADNAVVQATWQRVRENGRDVSGEVQSGTFTLQQGQRQTLESITIPALGSCAERTASLDIAYTRRRVPTSAQRAGLTSAAVGSGRGTGGSAAGVSNGVSNSPSGTRSEGGRSTRLAGVVSRGTGGGAAVGGVVNVPGGVSSRFPLVDLWLVQTMPDEGERIQHLQTEVSPFPHASTFPRVSITTARGTFSVDVECYVENGLTPEGEPRLFVSANRRVDFVPTTGQVRDRRVLVEGSIKTAVERPGPGDVLEFELPPIQYPGAPAVADRLAIRLRLVTPSPN